MVILLSLSGEETMDKKTQYGLLIEMYSGGVAANRQDLMSMERVLRRVLIELSNYTRFDALTDDIRAILDRCEQRIEDENASKKELMAPEGVSIH